MNWKIILIIILLAAAVLGILYFILGRSEFKPTQQTNQNNISIDTLKSKSNPQANQSSPATLTGLEIAKYTTFFLDKTIKPDGSFYLLYACDPKLAKTCLRSDPGGEHAGQIVLSYLELSQKTQEAKYKQKANQALQVFLKHCLQKELNYCEVNFFPLYAYYKTTKQQSYLDAMVSIEDRFLADQPLAVHVQKSHGIKLGLLFEVTGNKKYLDQLVKSADQLLAGKLDNDPKNQIIYKEDSFTMRSQTPDIIWGYFIPAYQATKDTRYLKAAQDVYNQGKIVQHYDEITKNGNIYALVTNLENLLNLAQLSKDSDNYLNQAHELAQKMIYDFWDTPQRKRYDGDYGWLSLLDQSRNRKEVLFSGWISKLFQRMDKQTFKL